MSASNNKVDYVVPRGDDNNDYGPEGFGPSTVYEQVQHMTFTEARQVYTAARSLQMLRDQFRGTPLADALNLQIAPSLVEQIEERTWRFSELYHDRQETTFHRRMRNGEAPRRPLR